MLSYESDAIGARGFLRGVLVRTFKALPWAIALVALSALPARADGFFTPFYGHDYGGDAANCSVFANSFTSCEDTHTNIGVSFGSMGKVIGFEQDISRAKDFFGKIPGIESSVFTLTSNVLVGVGVGPVQPYGLIGFGLIRPSTSLAVASSVGDFSKNSLGFDFGAGVNGYFSKHVGIRADLRRFQTIQDVPIPAVTSQVFKNEKLSFWRFSIGLALR